MKGATLVFTECWLLTEQVWVDVHIVGAANDPQPRRVGRFVFSGPVQSMVWGFLRRVLKRDPNDPPADTMPIVLARGNPDTINYGAIPAAIMIGIREHIDRGMPTGDYLTAILKNDLVTAVGHADQASLAALRDTVMWLCNNAPNECWGNPEKVRQWREAKAKGKPPAAQAATEAEETP